MITNINKIINLLKTFIGSVLGISSLYLIDVISSFLGETPALFLLLMIIIFLTSVSERILISLVENSSKLRKRIAGKHYIEGVWFDTTVSPSDSSMVITASIFKIFYENRELKYSGELFDADGESIGVFRSTSVKYNNDFSLFSSYEASMLTSKNLENSISGFAQYIFVENEDYPVNLHGYAIDNLEGKKRVIMAQKITDIEVVKKIKNPEFRKKFVLNNKN